MMGWLLCALGFHHWGPWRKTGYCLEFGLNACQRKGQRPGCYEDEYEYRPAEARRRNREGGR